jgi:2-phospho-L-lactate guanylyltransferase (CobY/MobA/RfbA family)
MSFGPASARAHERAARAAGVEVAVLELERLAFDVDAPADLDELPSLAAGAATRGWLDARAHANATGTR